MAQTAEFRHPPRQRSRRLGGDDGAALVEFALVMPVLALFLFGLVEFGINLNDYQSIRQAVRDTARNAIVQDYGNSGTCAQAGSTGSDNANAMICTTRANSGLGSNLTVQVIFTDNNGSNDFTTDKVKVCAVAKAKSVTGIISPFLKSVYLKSGVETRAEKKLTLTTTTNVDPSGGNWSWC